jgi:hypothetical protein
LACDGTAVSRTTFADLFTAIGVTYGAGNGSTTFNLPDTRSRMPIGAGTGTGLTNRALGTAGGGESKTINSANLPTHTHAIDHDHPATSSGTESADHTHSGSTGGISANHVHAIGIRFIGYAGGGNGATTVSAPSLASMILGGLGNFSSLNSPTGASGGATTPAAGSNIILGTTYGSIVTGGAGGGGASSAGVSANGGNVTIPSTPPTYQSVTGGTSTSVNGGNGFFKFQPMFYSMGGGGGFGNGTGVGGNGGIGGNGSGGGGGGAGTTGGSGGRGGDGLVIIVCW